MAKRLGMRNFVNTHVSNFINGKMSDFINYVNHRFEFYHGILTNGKGADMHIQLHDISG